MPCTLKTTMHRTALCLAAMLLGLCGTAHATTLITTVAGGGASGPPDGPPLSIGLDGPSDLALDGAGRLVVMSSGFGAGGVACWVARLTADGSQVNRVAGDGSCSRGWPQPNFGGDGGPATLAQISGDTDANAYPGLTVDAAGNIYIADFNNNRVRKVDAVTGLISTVAGNGTAGFSGDGGAATAAQLSYPTRVAVDASGNLYIAGGGRIRKVAAATGLISTVAGNGTIGYGGDGGPATAAALNSPMGMALVASGDLYFADMNNARIRRVDAATGTITTVAGTGTWGYSGDGGAATAAKLGSPSGVARDAAGNFYIADYDNNRIRKVDAVTGIISTVAGNGTAGFGGDGGVATAAQLSWPTGIAVDAAGNLYIADNQNNRVRKVDAASGNIATLIGTGGPATPIQSMAAASAPLAAPVGLALGGGKLYFADMSKNFLNQLNLSTGLVDTVAGTGVFASGGDGGPATAAQLSGPTGVARDAQGNLYIADTYGNRVRKVDAASGLISTVAGTGTQGSSGDGGAATAAALNRPQGLALDAAGNLYIADGGVRVRKVSAASGIISTVAGTTQGFTGDGGLATAAKLNQLASLAFDAAGNLHIADSGNCRIRKVDAASGVISTIAGSVCGFSGDGGPATSAQLQYPTGIAFDSAGSLFIADYQNHRIRKVDTATGLISTVAGTGTAGFGGDGGASTAAQLKLPTDLAIDVNGILYVVDQGNRRLRRLADTPNAPTAVVATAGDTQARVDFAAPAAGSLPISRYTVVSNPAGGVDAQAGTTATSHTLTGLTNGTSYTFTVVATNGVGDGPVSAASNAVTPATIPGAPTGVSASANASNGQATVSFSAPASNGGSAITGYTVVSNPAGGVDAQAGATALSHTVTGLTNGTSYTFTVVATNGVGDSVASVASNAVVPGAVVGTGGRKAALGAGSWVLNSAQTAGFIPATGHAKSPTSQPAGYSFPHGLLDFTLTGGASGSTATLVLTYPSALPAGTVYWKYGPSPAGYDCANAPACAEPHWYRMPASQAVVSGNTVTLTITDGGVGDDDLLANGTIVDAGGPGVPLGGGVAGVPTLSQWGLLCLSGLMLMGFVFTRPVRRL
ncbi:hypothetical protein GCM10028785_11410 [Hydrogenophaga soli]